MTHDEKIEKRTNDCLEVEMQFKGDSFYGKFPYNSDFNVHNTELLCSTDEEWQKIIESLRQELVRRKALEPIETFPIINSADEISSDGIRIINGVKYQIIKVKCMCPCHAFPGRVKHVRACCNGGYNEHLVRIKE
jgi:hypothetical protein